MLLPHAITGGESLQNPSHEPVFGPTSTFAGCPTRTQHIGGLTVDTVRRVHPELLIHPFVDSGRADVGIELCYFRSDILPNQEVGRNGVAGGIS